MSIDKDDMDLSRIERLTKLGSQVISLQSRITEMSKVEQKSPVTFWYLNEYVYPLLRNVIAILIEVIGDQ